MARTSDAQRPIALLSDFGTESPYVGTMKAVILSINPAAKFFDLGHGVSPQAIEEGAFLLEAIQPYLPARCITVAVVDPGVGTARNALAIGAGDRCFVGPDNGVLSAAVPGGARESSKTAGQASPISVPASIACVRLTNPAYFRLPVSATFQGRDVFAPVAAHLSLGVPLSDLGDQADSIQVFPPWRAAPDAAGGLAARVVSVDHFGNLITDVPGEDVAGRTVRVEIAGHRIEGLSRTFREATGLLAYIGSAGFLELALRDGSAAAALDARRGDPVRITLGDESGRRV
jgi:S-adenosylmethionine hydrolase